MDIHGGNPFGGGHGQDFGHVGAAGGVKTDQVDGEASVQGVDGGPDIHRLPVTTRNRSTRQGDASEPADGGQAPRAVTEGGLESWPAGNVSPGDRTLVRRLIHEERYTPETARPQRHLFFPDTVRLTGELDLYRVEVVSMQQLPVEIGEISFHPAAGVVDVPVSENRQAVQQRWHPGSGPRQAIGEHPGGPVPHGTTTRSHRSPAVS